tara:strand:+ start:425 stop:871 length:447 start_codon:yes stop_codon:yes gene_type:complete
MNLSFFTVTVLYLSLLLYIHHKLKFTKIGHVQPLNIVRHRDAQLDTIISLDDIDSNIENDTIRDLKKFLATPEIHAKETFAPIIESLDLNEYFSDDSDDSVDGNEKIDHFIADIKEDISNTPESGGIKPFDSIKAFDDFGGYENYATF